jgi:hypothetical protein
MNRASRPLTGRLVIPAFSLMAIVGVVVACGGTDDAVGANAPDAGSSPDGSTEDASATADGGGALSDGGTEAIGDGGANLDPDAGTDAPLPDGGKCNELANSAKAIVSTCASIAPVLGGGSVVTGTYVLASVTALGTPNFCNAQFVATGLRQTFQVSATATGFEGQTVTEIGGGGGRRRSQTITAQQTQLILAQTCPTSETLTARYASGVVNGKQRLVLRLPYGKGEALYVYELP